MLSSYSLWHLHHRLPTPDHPTHPEVTSTAKNQPVHTCLLKLQSCLKNWEQKLIEKFGTKLSE